MISIIKEKKQSSLTTAEDAFKGSKDSLLHSFAILFRPADFTYYLVLYLAHEAQNCFLVLALLL